MDATTLFEGYTIYTDAAELAAAPEGDAPATSPVVLTITVSLATKAEGC
ncbi:LxmA leader domain family RiPP [Streptomyces sp. NPDC003710]